MSVTLERGKPLDPENKAILSGWLQQTGFKLACPVCQHKEWNAGKVIAVFPLSDRGIQLGPESAKTAAMVQVVCGHCAYALPFDAVPVGILP
jgi:hypothetical protein